MNATEADASALWQLKLRNRLHAVSLTFRATDKPISSMQQHQS